MKKAKWFLSSILMLLFFSFGCSSSDDNSVSTDSGAQTTETSFNFTLASFKSQETANTASGMQASFTADQIMTGQLTATNTVASTVQTFDWSIYFDEDTFDVQSNKTIILTPGTYEFALLLTKGDQQYAGSAVQAISDGTFDVPMTIRPIIGNTVTDVSLLASLAEFKFSYDPAELAAASLANPQMGIIVDGGIEEVFTINPGNGISDNYINLDEGSHSIQLALYDGSLQRGRSITAQETVIVSAGLNIAMDLVALHGETTFALTEAGGDATFSFNIPAEVVDEAGGLANLEVLFSLAGDNNTLEENVLSLTQAVSGDYEATMTLTDKQFDVVTVSLAFTDTSVSELLGSCSMAATLDTTQRTLSCNVTLRRRAIIGGALLAILGINAFNEAGEPVAGATISESGNILGVTGSGAFGTAGYLKTYIAAGDYTVKAEANGNYGEEIISVTPLNINNIDITTNIASDLSSSCIYLDVWDSPRPYVIMTLTFSNSGADASYRPIFYEDNSCNSAQWAERRDRTRVSTGSVASGYGEVYFKVESTVPSRPYFTTLTDPVTDEWNANGMMERQDWVTGIEQISMLIGDGCDGSILESCPEIVFFQEYFIDTSITPARLFIRESTYNYVDLSILTEPSSTSEIIYFEWAGSGTPTGLDGDWTMVSKTGTISGTIPSNDPPQSGTWMNMGTVDQLTTFGVSCSGTSTSPPIVCNTENVGKEIFIAAGGVYVQISGEYEGGMSVPQGSSIDFSSSEVTYTGPSGCSGFNSSIVTATRYYCRVDP